MPKINPFIGLFLAIAAMNIGLFGWQRADMTALETRIEARFSALETRIEERFAAIEERFTAIEARFTALETRIETRFAGVENRLVRIEAGQSELRERMARIEGTVAGALARPDRLAQAPTNETEAAN